MPSEIKLIVNSETYNVMVEPDDLLVDVLRDKLGLTGTKKGCASGDCGACTILMDGRPITSCLVLAVAAAGKTLETIEGMGDGQKLHVLQQCFIDYGAIQCGYCTPGMLLMAQKLLEENPNPSEAEIRAGIAGNLCRCTGYTKIIDAIMAASVLMPEVTLG